MVRFLVDGEAEMTVYAPLSRIREAFLPDAHGRTVLDVGGGNGSFGALFAQRGARVLPIDTDRRALLQADSSLQAVRGSLLQIPVRDGSADAVVGRAVLHHVPDALPLAVSEIARVLAARGTLLIQEPCAGNLPAALARRFFPTDRHEPGERVLPLTAYVEAIRARFEVEAVTPHFLTSYLLPHLVGRFPTALRPLARRVTAVLAGVDEGLLEGSSRLASRAAYVSIEARKR